MLIIKVCRSRTETLPNTNIWGKVFTGPKESLYTQNVPNPANICCRKENTQKIFFCLGNRGRKSIVGMTWSTEWIAFWVGSTMGLSWRAGVAGEDYCIFFH